MLFLTVLALVFCATSASAVAIPNIQLSPRNIQKCKSPDARYLSFKCAEWQKSNTTAFNQCCTKNLNGNLPSHCTPGKALASSSVALPTSTIAPPAATYTPTPVPSPAPAPTPAKNLAVASPPPSPPPPKPASNTGGDITHSGVHATWYRQNGQPGACGDYHSDNDYIVALGNGVWKADRSNCGMKVRVQRVDTGETVNATVADFCPTCLGKSDIDLSRGAFGALAAYDVGLVKVNWWYTS